VIQTYLQQLVLPQATSHKGENGKVLIIGGSDLFQAASQWSFQVVSRIVDMTFYSSVAENNEIIRDAKYFAQDGVVVKRSDIPQYIQEADSVLIGPGMRRDFHSRFSLEQMKKLSWDQLTELDWEFDTQAVTAILLSQFPQKQWVIDAGALQVLRPSWLPPHAILTPHHHELEDFLKKLSPSLAGFTEQIKEVQLTIAKHISSQAAEKNGRSQAPQVIAGQALQAVLPKSLHEQMLAVSAQLQQANLIVKGPVDLMWDAQQVVAVSGGNAGLTKGGSGDALAGLITAFAAKSPPFASIVVASYLNKLASHDLYGRRAMMFNTSDLVAQIPLSWHNLLQSLTE